MFCDRCGFSQQQCKETLQLCDGDVGAALEYLLTELKSNDQPGEVNGCDGDVPSEIAEIREDEKLALQSIYEHRFEERLLNRVWVLHLELPELKELLNFKKSVPCKEEIQEICKFYKKGHCRFGGKCRYLHASPDVNMKKQSDKLQGPLADNLFALEIRFPAGNMYPLEAPLIAFSSLIDRPPPHTCLNISRYLMQSSQQWAEMQSPAVFSLIDLLADKDMLEMLLEMPPPLLTGSSLAIATEPCHHPKSEAASQSSVHSGTVDKSQRDDCHSSRRESSAQQGRSGTSGESKPRPKAGSAKQLNPKDDSADKSANILKQNKKLMEEFRKKPVSLMASSVGFECFPFS